MINTGNYWTSVCPLSHNTQVSAPSTDKSQVQTEELEQVTIQIAKKFLNLPKSDGKTPLDAWLDVATRATLVHLCETAKK